MTDEYLSGNNNRTPTIQIFWEIKNKGFLKHNGPLKCRFYSIWYRISHKTNKLFCQSLTTNIDTHCIIICTTLTQKPMVLRIILFRNVVIIDIFMKRAPTITCYTPVNMIHFASKNNMYLINTFLSYPSLTGDIIPAITLYLPPLCSWSRPSSEMHKVSIHDLNLFFGVEFKWHQLSKGHLVSFQLH
jgi:hypothetical protein